MEEKGRKYMEPMDVAKRVIGLHAADIRKMAHEDHPEWRKIIQRARKIITEAEDMLAEQETS